MIEPIRLILEMYAFEPCDDVTRQEVQHTLDQLYPEAIWEVGILEDFRRFNGMQFSIVPRFDSPEKETFYLMKWT